MNKKYNLKLDLQFRCNNSTMKFNQFDNNTSDFFMRITNGGNLVDIEKAIVVLAIIKPSGKIASQFVEVKNGLVYVDLKPSMKDEIGTYTAQAMLILEDERVVTNVISYEVEEDKIFSLLNDTVEATEEFTLLTDMLSRLSTVEISEEQRIINEAERILSEENRKIEEAKRVEAELIRQHEEADRTKYDAIRESNENIRKQNESIRLANETNRIDEETKRVDEESKRVEAEQLRKDNYNFMTEDEERRRTEANAHKEAEVLRVQAETNRVNEEAKRRTTEQARVLAENTRVSNENTRKANETTRQTNETHRVEAETQRQNRYNSFIADAEANANNFENYTNTAKVKEDERKSNELDRKSQEDRRVANEVERISNENTRKANEKAREKNETSRQNIFENKVDEVDKKIIEINVTKDDFVSSINTKVDTKISELNTTKDNFVSSVNTKVDSKISELDNTKSDMATSINNKVNEVENRFNALTSKQQQDAEVIDARDGETSLKARLDRDIEKAKQVYVNVEGSNISTDSSDGYLKNVEILGNTIQSASNLADIRSVGDKVEGQELYEIPVLSVGKNLFDGNKFTPREAINQYSYIDGILTMRCDGQAYRRVDYILPNTLVHGKRYILTANVKALEYSSGYTPSQNFGYGYYNGGSSDYYGSFDASSNTAKLEFVYNEQGENVIGFHNEVKEGLTKLQWSNIQLEEGTQATPYEPYIEDKLTILSPVQLEKVGDVADKIIEKDGVFGVEKNIIDKLFNGSENWVLSGWAPQENTIAFKLQNTNNTNLGICDKFILNRNNSTIDTEAFNVDSVWNEISIRINKSKLSTQDVTGFKKWLSDNTVLIMYSDNTSTFIPLPHDQQIKLRTFANKTNISFGCEIEGTIKAQVPKSLGATVNTHTEQIRSLNNELNRVKKLEESTVSTVTTESDFTTVEATSNGYFEDVRLEGKTLVNLSNLPSSDITISNSIGNGRITPLRQLTSSDTLYLTFNCTSINFDADLGIIYSVSYKDGTPTEYIAIRDDKTVGCKKIRIIPKSDIQHISIFLHGNNSSSASATISDVMLMYEKDCDTQNPPAYFEGLKSVGQSATTSEDGLDEISVESVNENLFDMSSKYEGAMILENGSKIDTQDWRLHDFIKVKPNGTYYLCDDGLNFYQFIVVLYDSNKNFIGRISRQGDASRVYTMPSNAFYCRINYSVSVAGASIVRNKIMFNEGTTPKPYIPHQSDKKRLLYYNEETQTWEKPILREWDSTEKHADGKYYYHQRSAEEVLNGSGNVRFSYDSVVNTRENENNKTSIYFGFSVPNCVTITFLDSPLVISDKFPSYSRGAVQNEVTNGICNNMGIRVSKSVIGYVDGDTTDVIVQKLNTWLQANNVTVVYQLAQEKVYECTNIDLITYNGETNYVVESGVLSPRTTLKVHNNISNVVSLLQKKVSLLESNVTSYMTTQNRLMLASRYNSDAVSFKVDYAVCSENMSQENYDTDLYNLILNNILVGKDNYDYNHMFNIIMDYASWSQISWDQFDILVGLMDIQHNPPIEEIPTDDEIVEEIPNEIM